MSKRLGWLVVALLALPMQAQAVITDTFSGALSTSDGGLTGFGGWATGVEIDWLVEFESDTNLWSYTYHFTADQKELSHILIEVSNGDDPFTKDNIFDGTTEVDAGPEIFEAQEVDESGSNPGLLQDFYALKFGGTDTDETIVIVTDRAPMWGDFYAVDGKKPGEETYVYNSGFTTADPTDGPADGSLQYHLLVPDTDEGPPPPPPGVIPEPSSMLLLGTGLLGAAGFKKSRKS